jgi:hypothetical protein
MSQKAALAAMDADLHAAFADAGLADDGLYTPPNAAPGATPVPVRVYVNRDVQDIGAGNQVSVGRVEVQYLLADVTPAIGGQLVVDGDTYINAGEMSNDGAIAVWAVRRG